MQVDENERMDGGIGMDKKTYFLLLNVVFTACSIAPKWPKTSYRSTLIGGGDFKAAIIHFLASWGQKN